MLLLAKTLSTMDHDAGRPNPRCRPLNRRNHRPISLVRSDSKVRALVAQDPLLTLRELTANRAELSEEHAGKVIADPPFEEDEIPTLECVVEEIRRLGEGSESMDVLRRNAGCERPAPPVLSRLADEDHDVGDPSALPPEVTNPLPAHGAPVVGRIGDHRDAASGPRLGKHPKPGLEGVDRAVVVVAQDDRSRWEQHR